MMRLGASDGVRHTGGFDSNTICNSLSPSLANIVRFGSLRIIISLTVLKRVY